jgi:hypothetical protein
MLIYMHRNECPCCLVDDSGPITPNKIFIGHISVVVDHSHSRDKQNWKWKEREVSSTRLPDNPHTLNHCDWELRRDIERKCSKVYFPLYYNVSSLLITHLTFALCSAQFDSVMRSNAVVFLLSGNRPLAKPGFFLDPWLFFDYVL